MELPFDFPFFGKNYKTMYIYNTGFVSFSEHTDYKEFPEPPSQIPTTDTFYTNIIAPFWGNHTMGTSEDDSTYYKEAGDHVVVSFVNYGNSVMLGMDFQLLLYKDGHYKLDVTEGVNAPRTIFTIGDTNMRTRFSCGAREFVNRWSEAGPTHHMAAATGHHIDTILKVAEIFNVPVDVITR